MALDLLTAAPFAKPVKSPRKRPQPVRNPLKKKPSKSK